MVSGVLMKNGVLFARIWYSIFRAFKMDTVWNFVTSAIRNTKSHTFDFPDLLCKLDGFFELLILTSNDSDSPWDENSNIMAKTCITFT